MIDFNEQDYQAWKRHPVSEVFFKFIDDQIANYREVAIQGWEAGNLNLAEDNEIKFRIRALKELEELKLESIKRFYAQQGKTE